MKLMMKSNTPWLAALWLCCGTAVVTADDDVVQEDGKKKDSVQKIIRKVIKDAEGDDAKAISVNVESVVTREGDGGAQEKVGGKIVIKTDDGKTQVIDLGDAIKKGGHRVLHFDGDKLKEMKGGIEDFRFDVLKDGHAIRIRSEDGEAAAPKYRIGVHCEPVSAALRAHIDVPKNALIVREVTEDGPAASAGMKQHDILVSIGDKELKSLEGLVASIQESNGEELALTVMRRGEKTTLRLKPTKRSESTEISELIHEKLLKEVGDKHGKFKFDFDFDVVGDGENIRIEAMRPGLVLDATADVEKVMKRLPMIIKRAQSGAKDAKGRVEYRVIKRDGGEGRGSRERRVRVIERDDDDHGDHEHAHEHGDHEEGEHHHGDDDDEDHHHDELRQRVEELSREIERLQRSLKKLKTADK